MNLNSFSYRIALLLGLMLVVSLVDLYRNGAGGEVSRIWFCDHHGCGWGNDRICERFDYLVDFAGLFHFGQGFGGKPGFADSGRPVRTASWILRRSHRRRRLPLCQPERIRASTGDIFPAASVALDACRRSDSWRHCLAAGIFQI